MADFSRRDFVRLLGATGAACAFAPGCGWPVNPPPLVHGDAVDAAGQIKVPANQLDLLGAEGAAIQLVASGWKDPLIVIAHQGQFVALDGTCTHLGCPLGYAAKSQLITCPCHGSTFGFDGAVHRPPATAPLRTYRTRVEVGTGDLVVDTLSAGGGLPSVIVGSIGVTVTAVPNLATWPSGFAFTPQGLSAPIWILRLDKLTFSVVDATCTLAPCVVTFQVPSQILSCPCHGCVYDSKGAVQNGPATQPLKSYATNYSAGTDFLAIMVG